MGNRSARHDPEVQVAERRYLEGRLRAFAKEEEWFVALAGDAVIESRFDAYSDAFTTEKPGECLKEFGDIRQAVDHFDRFVLVGDPGAGKSTTLRRLATDIARARLDPERTWHVPLPLWIDLGASTNPADTDELLRYWWRQYDLPGTPEGYLNNQDGWLFLDGLNEMPEQGGSPKERAKSLHALLERYPQLPAIITCRVRDYDESLRLGLPVVQIHPLDEVRIERFARKRLRTYASTFLEALEPDALQRMASNPYFLAMMTEIYRERQQLPTDLHRLYEMYMDLRYQEYTKRGLMQLPWERLKRQLQNLAFRMIADRKGTVAELEWVRQQISPVTLRDGVDLGTLVQDEKAGTMRFYHQSLHGYFALPGLTQALGPEVPPEDRWRFIRQIGYLGEAGEPAVPPLIKALSDESRTVRETAAKSLGQIGAPAAEAVPALAVALADDTDGVRSSAALALGGIGQPAAEAVPALTNALRDESRVVCRVAAEALGQIGAPAVPALINALHDESADVRRVAAEALGQIGAPAVPALINALHDESADVRSVAIVALVCLGVPAVPALINALHDESAWMREAAAEVLKRIASDIPFVSPFKIKVQIRKVATGVEIIPVQCGENVRAESAAEVVPVLIEALHDENTWVRHTAAGILACIGEPAAEAVPALTAALRDESEDVRRYAARALVRIGIPEALDALRQAGYDVDV